MPRQPLIPPGAVAAAGGPRRAGGARRPAGPAAHGELPLPPIVGASARMQRLLKLVARVAPTESTVLILGESGTGKELVARSLHVLSPRAQGPFVAVNVAALPDSLIESELFGYARGAFTGAASDRAGLVEEAHQGTLFLDEIGDMPPGTQVKLLRTLENNEVRRLGENTPRLVDVRVVAATHRDLQSLVAEGRFRGDLYYRLNVVQIEMPPLRERGGDVGLLASYFLDRAARRTGRSTLRFTPEAEMLLGRYDWPGNVRELENACERIAQTCTCGTVRVGCMSASILLRAGGPPPDLSVLAPPAAPPQEPAAVSLDDRIRDLEANLIGWALKVSNGNKSRAAELLQIKRSTLGDRINRCGLSRYGGPEVHDERTPAEVGTDVQHA